MVAVKAPTPSSSSSSPPSRTAAAKNTNNGKSQSNGTVSREPGTIKTPMSTYLALAAVALITCFTIPTPLQPVGQPSLQHVWYYGWITAVSTGFGVLPLVLVPKLDSYWVGITNGIAAGMMIAASYSLFTEGYTFSEDMDTSDWSSGARTAIGALLGLAFILLTKQLLDGHGDDLSIGGLDGTDAKRALLIFFVMTLHSFSEGVGIGVSFGGTNGSELGVFISASLAVHNVPEGLAVAVAMIPKGTSMMSAALSAIISSLPQPIMAIPAYLFVNSFIPILPVGLGFAGGAMAWVALFELLFEAYEDTNLVTTACVSTVSLCTMLFFQGAIDLR